jgi:sirohydrochlorin ferrochelatase
MNLVLCSHGTASPAGQAAVASLVSAVACRSSDEVVPAFVDVHGPYVGDVVTSDSVVVPLLLGDGYHVNVDIAAAVAASPGAIGTRALGPDTRITRLLLERLRAVGATRKDLLFLAAAGSSEEAADAAVRRTARELSIRCGSPVTVAYGASRSPSLADEVVRLRAAAPHRRIVAVSYLLASGHFHQKVLDCGADLVTEPLLTTHRPVDERLVELVLSRASVAGGQGWRGVRGLRDATVTVNCSAFGPVQA